jgi:hypothetical protein
MTVDVWAGETCAGMNMLHYVTSTVLYYHLLSPPCHSILSIEDVTNVPNMSAPDLCQNGSVHAIQIDPATSCLIGNITYDQGHGFNLEWNSKEAFKDWLNNKQIAQSIVLRPSKIEYRSTLYITMAARMGVKRREKKHSKVDSMLMAEHIGI